MVILTNTSEVEAQLNAKVVAAAKKAATQSVEKIKQKLKKSADKAIDDWYAGYGPRFYSRTGAIKDYTLVDDAEGLGIDIEQHIANHQNNDYVIGIVVEEGYHGGSYGDGASSPRYRSPVPESSVYPRAFYKDENGQPVLDKYGNPKQVFKGYTHWSRHAQQSPPIGSKINASVAQLNKEAQTLADQIFDRELSSIFG